MRKEFIVAKIQSTQDGSQYVHVTFIDEKEYRSQEKKNQSQLGPGTGTFNSIEDLMKNMPKIIANMPGLGGGGAPSESPTVKLSMREYEDMNIKVGDKVYFDILKRDDNINSGV
jgi:hypothetical protein